MIFTVSLLQSTVGATMKKTKKTQVKILKLWKLWWNSLRETKTKIMQFWFHSERPFDRRYDLLIIVTTAQVAKPNNSLVCWRTKQLHCLCLIAINLFSRVEKRKMRCKHRRRIYLNNALPISPPCSFHFPQLFSILLIFLFSFSSSSSLGCFSLSRNARTEPLRLFRSSNSTSHFFSFSKCHTAAAALARP